MDYNRVGDITGSENAKLVALRELAPRSHLHFRQDELYHAASHWSSGQRAVPLQPRRAGITYSVASTGQPEFIEDTANHLAYVQAPPDMRPGALACPPLAKVVVCQQHRQRLGLGIDSNATCCYARTPSDRMDMRDCLDTSLPSCRPSIATASDNGTLLSSAYLVCHSC
jgi:hypothetical protein